MSAIVNGLNHIVTTLNAISPGWYIVVAGPLANIAQHFLKKERQFTHSQNKLISIVLAGVAGAFYAALHAGWGAGFITSFQQWLGQLAIVGTPIWLVSQTLFHAVSNKLDALNALQTPTTPVTATSTAAPVATPETAPAAPESTPAAPAPTDV